VTVVGSMRSASMAIDPPAFGWQAPPTGNDI